MTEATRRADTVRPTDRCVCGHRRENHSQGVMCLFGGCRCKRFTPAHNDGEAR